MTNAEFYSPQYVSENWDDLCEDARDNDMSVSEWIKLQKS